MYTTIRRYRIKLGQADQAIHLAQAELMPVVCSGSGFVSYQAILAGRQSLVTVSTYRNREAAAAADATTAEWVDTRLASLIEGPPGITVGEVRAAVNGVDDPTSV